MANTYVQTALDLGGSDSINEMLQHATQTIVQQGTLQKERQQFLKKFQTQTIAPQDIVSLAIRCIKLGRFDEALLFLSDPALCSAELYIQAASEYQRARCFLLMGQPHNASEHIKNSLALINAKKTQQYNAIIDMACYVIDALNMLIDNIAWDDLKESRELGSPCVSQTL